MNIGILTLHYTFNPGAIAQAYCLSKFLNAHIIDYVPITFKEFVDARKEANEFFRSCFYWGRENLRLSPSLSTYEDYVDYANTLDLLVVGSDEVLNQYPFQCDVGCPSVYYGVDIKIPKILWAASSNPNQAILGPSECEALRNFDVLSVRDWHTFYKLPSKLANTTNIVPDPTFALENWYPKRDKILQREVTTTVQWSINNNCHNPLEWFSRISSLYKAKVKSFHQTVACILGNVEITQCLDNRRKTLELLSLVRNSSYEHIIDQYQDISNAFKNYMYHRLPL
jgi:hypothetical protein